MKQTDQKAEGKHEDREEHKEEKADVQPEVEEKCKEKEDDRKDRQPAASGKKRGGNVCGELNRHTRFWYVIVCAGSMCLCLTVHEVFGARMLEIAFNRIVIIIYPIAHLVGFLLSISTFQRVQLNDILNSVNSIVSYAISWTHCCSLMSIYYRRRLLQMRSSPTRRKNWHTQPNDQQSPAHREREREREDESDGDIVGDTHSTYRETGAYIDTDLGAETEMRETHTRTGAGTDQVIHASCEITKQWRPGNASEPNTPATQTEAVGNPTPPPTSQQALPDPPVLYKERSFPPSPS